MKRALWKHLVAVAAVGFAFGLLISPARTQNWQKTGDKVWVTKWLGLELITATGGFAVSATKDHISDGTNKQHTHESVSTLNGVGAVKDMVVKMPAANGGDRRWKVITIKEDDQNNMSTSWGLADQTNITWHGIIVLVSPNDRKTTGNFAHDDHAQVWVNGKKIYDNSQWTGAVKNTKPAEVTLNKGGNVLLFKCGESGGADYVNAHFTAADGDLKILPTTDNLFFDHLSVVSVEPKDKLASTWGYMKVLR